MSTNICINPTLDVYSPFENKGKVKSYIITFENGEFSRTLRKKYHSLLFNFFSQNNGDINIREYLDRKNSGHIWRTMFYGVAFISSEKVMRTEGIIKAGPFKTSIKMENTEYSLSDILRSYSYDTKHPAVYTYKKILRNLHIGKIKDYAWYALVFVLAYYIFTQLFLFIF